MAVSKPQIWDGADRDPAGTRRGRLTRQFLNGEERTEDSLLAVEVELIGIGEIAVDPVAQTCPTERIAAAGEMLHHLSFLGDRFAGSEPPAGGVGNHSGEKLREQLRVGSISL